MFSRFSFLYGGQLLSLDLFIYSLGLCSHQWFFDILNDLIDSNKEGTKVPLEGAADIRIFHHFSRTY